MNPTTRITLLLAVALMALGSTACSSRSDGQATPTPNPSNASNTPPANPTSIGDDNTAAAALDTLDPCTLLTTAEISQFGAQSGKRAGTTRTPSCVWQILGGNGLFSVDLRSQQGLKDIVVDLGTPADQKVGNRDGKILKDDHGPSSGACMVSIGITESSRVDVQGIYKNDTAVACDRALKVAGLVEPRLPKGE